MDARCSVQDCDGAIAGPEARWCTTHAPVFLGRPRARASAAEIAEIVWADRGLAYEPSAPPPVTFGRIDLRDALLAADVKVQRRILAQVRRLAPDEVRAYERELLARG